MDFFCISEREARLRYERSRDKNKELRILADLTGSSIRDISKFLGASAVLKQQKLPDDVVCCGKLADTNVVELYAEGLCDKEIAENLGVASATIRAWRNRNNLPLNRPQPADSERLELYRKGYSDAKIGHAVGVTKSAICSWRHRHGLQALY